MTVKNSLIMSDSAHMNLHRGAQIFNWRYKKENTVQEEAFKKNQGLVKDLVKKKTNVTFDVKCCWQPLIPVLWTHHGLYSMVCTAWFV